MLVTINDDHSDVQHTMRRPAEPLIVYVEASGFGGHSYPIEVGLALEGGHEVLHADCTGAGLDTLGRHG